MSSDLSLLECSEIVSRLKDRCRAFTQSLSRFLANRSDSRATFELSQARERLFSSVFAPRVQEIVRQFVPSTAEVKSPRELAIEEFYILSCDVERLDESLRKDAFDECFDVNLLKSYQRHGSEFDRLAKLLANSSFSPVEAWKLIARASKLLDPFDRALADSAYNNDYDVSDFVSETGADIVNLLHFLDTDAAGLLAVAGHDDIDGLFVFGDPDDLHPVARAAAHFGRLRNFARDIVKTAAPGRRLRLRDVSERLMEYHKGFGDVLAALERLPGVADFVFQAGLAAIGSGVSDVPPEQLLIAAPADTNGQPLIPVVENHVVSLAAESQRDPSDDWPEILICSDPKVSDRIVFRGQGFPLDNEPARFFKELLDARGNWVDGLSRKYGTRPDRLKRKIPKPFDSLVEGQSGAGQRISSAKLAELRQQFSAASAAIENRREKA